MSFFVLFKHDSPPETLDAFNRNAHRHHLENRRSETVGAYRICWYTDLRGEEPASYFAANGDFIIVHGTLIYRGEAAPACLPGLLNDFRVDSHDWGGMVGIHTVCICKAGRLYLFGDGLGASKMYVNRDRTLWSNSFLAMLEMRPSNRLDTQACYEYVINGSVFGSRTLLEDVNTLPANAVLVVYREVNRIDLASPIGNEPVGPEVPLDQIADTCVHRLDRVFEPIARQFDERLRLSFSGGFDSRLMLAMLMKHGARPTLFVYGHANDEDVEIARLIARNESLPLEHIDKSTAPAVSPEDFPKEMESNLFAFDGWKIESGLFDFGADRLDRLKRHAAGQVPLNGSLGEIYRNFFYMPDRPSSTAAVVNTFYSRYDPRAFTERFDESRYVAAMQAAMREAIGVDTDALDRSQVEQLYPKFRGRFWTGRDAQLNQRFGPMFFPYLEHAAISNTSKIPIRYKDLGRLQGRMIARVNARLAAYPSDYGFALDGPRPWKYRAKTLLSTQRPSLARKYSFRLTHRTMQPRSGALAAGYLSRVIDATFPIMRSLFTIDAVASAEQFGLIATLEYLAERYDLDIPD